MMMIYSQVALFLFLLFLIELSLSDSNIEKQIAPKIIYKNDGVVHFKRDNYEIEPQMQLKDDGVVHFKPKKYADESEDMFKKMPDRWIDRFPKNVLRNQKKYDLPSQNDEFNNCVNGQEYDCSIELTPDEAEVYRFILENYYNKNSGDSKYRTVRILRAGSQGYRAKFKFLLSPYSYNMKPLMEPLQRRYSLDIDDINFPQQTCTATMEREMKNDEYFITSMNCAPVLIDLLDG